MINLSIQNQEEFRLSLLWGRATSSAQGGFLLRSLAVVVCASIFGLFSFNAAAADAGATLSKSLSPIAVSLKQFKVVKDGRDDVKFVDASVVVPGDVIEYRAIYSNTGTGAVPVVATLPIPLSLEYLKDSASAKNIAHTVALKDSQFSKEPLLQKVVTASGATLSQPVPYASYRYVRWDLGNLSPGKSVEVSVRAKVAQNLEVVGGAEEKLSDLASVLSIKK